MWVPERNVPQVRRCTVEPHHSVGKHGEVTPSGIRSTVTLAEGAAPIHRINHHQIAVELDPGSGRRKSTRQRDVIPHGFAATGLAPMDRSESDQARYGKQQAE